MQMFWTLFAILGLAASVFLGNIQDWRDTETQGEIAAIAGSMQVYRGAVAAYQASNPTASGTVADTQLGLPTWYVKAPGISNVIQAGKVYVFYSQPKPGLAEALLKRTDNALTVGIKQSGNLVNPRRGVVASLPSAIPDGSVVF
ncbi:TPA: type IV pilus biogenesis protein PilM [Pseudomonas aeruginosa]